MINLKSLTFAYRRQPKLFDSLDLQLEPGQIYGLLGRNGAGKTTLLRMLAGLLFPQSGQVEVMGFEPRRRQQAFLADVFFLTEDHYLPALRIDQLVQCYAPFYPKFDEQYFKDVIQEFGLTSSQHVQDLSHGERKKVGIAFGLATGCRLMLMDEPTNGLDIPAKKQFRKLIAGAVGQERTFLISSHQVRDLQELIDPIIILDQGKVLLQADLETIGRKVAFQLQFREPGAGEAFYYERVPGGYLCVKPGAADVDSSEIDLEILFNAIIQQPESFRKLFQKTLKHENQ